MKKKLAIIAGVVGAGMLGASLFDLGREIFPYENYWTVQRITQINSALNSLSNGTPEYENLTKIRNSLNTPEVQRNVRNYNLVNITSTASAVIGGLMLAVGSVGYLADGLESNVKKNSKETHRKGTGA